MSGPTRRTRRAPRHPAVAAVLLLVVAVVAFTTAPHDAAAQLDPPPPEPLPAAYLLVDADTGEVLAAHDEHETMLVASTIKLLTALTTLEHLPTDTVLTVSQRAADAPAYDMGMQPDEQWRLLDTLSAMLIVSANDAAYVLAEGSAGTVEDFTDQMTATGARLGTVDSTFGDPSGLDNEFSIGGSMVSAWDLAVIGRNALAVPVIAERVALENQTLVDLDGDTRTLPSRNSLFLSMYDGADGLKTGGTDAAGNHIVASATRDGRTLIAVVLGIPSTIQWAASLLDSGFSGAATPTGETIPDVDIRLADTTRDALIGTAAVLGRGAFTFDGDAPQAPVEDAVVDEPETEDSAAPAPVAQSADDSSGGLGGWVWLLGIALVVLAVLVFLRRRAVKRRRKRRIERQRSLAEARRRGMIDVIEPSGQGGSSVQVMRRRDR